MRIGKRTVPLVLLTCGLLPNAACTVMKLVVTEPRVLSAAQLDGRVTLHLRDGSTVFYPKGVAVRDGSFVGAGVRYDLVLRSCGVAGAVPADSVVRVTRVARVVDGVKTAALNGLPVAAFAAMLALYETDALGSGWD